MANRIVLGSKFYLFRNNEGGFNAAEDHLLISAHGGYMDLWGPLKSNIIRVPEWTQLYFYAAHGSTIRDPGVYNILKGNFQVSETVGSGGSVTNYELSKYQGSHGNENETYASISANIDQNNGVLEDVQSGANKSRNYAFRFDVLTVRNRRFRSDPTLSDVFAALAENNYRYENIHCSFCRSPMFGRSGDASAQRWGT